MRRGVRERRTRTDASTRVMRETQSRPRAPVQATSTPTAPRSAPIAPTANAGSSPAGVRTAPFRTPLPVVVAVAPAPVPEPDELLAPVRFVTEPIGRELSANAHVDELQRHEPATGSQKGVEQLDGTVRGRGQQMQR
jgi:hypothetical protein